MAKRDADYKIHNIAKKTRQESNEQIECPICLEVIKTREKYTLECKHTYHKECIDSVINSPHCDNVCSMCRYPLHLADKDRERKRAESLRLHILLLHHTYVCSVNVCRSDNCNRMKWIRIHQTKCRNAEMCTTLNKFNGLLRLHSQHCIIPNCIVPHANSINPPVVA